VAYGGKMIHDKWFISDTHFFHANVLKFKDLAGHKVRPFQDVKEMNEYMIKKWNSVVKDNDNVYHLGDVTFDYGKEFNQLMSRLKGRKRLILGNHDKIKGTNLLDWFEKVDLWKGFKEHNFTASHIPLMLQSLRDGAYNVHGHVHQNSLNNPNYINVSVEVRDYTPVNIDEISEEIKRAHKDTGQRVVG
jgi:calcineurin-like phosphoesterase family protein